MSRFATPLFALMLANPLLRAQGDIENVVVETYYISDANDATATIGGPLMEGSRTYRIFLDLCADCSLRAIYGDANHPLIISSTALFFNHKDRGRTYGHQINKSWLSQNTVALDSWLAMSAATNQNFGVLKDEDPNGAVGTIFPNDAGLIMNNDPGAGIPLTVADGLDSLHGGVALPPNFNILGTDDPADVFKDTTVAAQFISTSVRIGCATPGVKGPTSENKILIAQLTTAGDLTFQLNVEVERANGTVVKYVANDSILLADETANGFLTYPPQCGCTDPSYLEFDPSAGCDDGSCLTPIVFGCLDTTACNYDPGANFNVTQLCCYGPDSCNGLDISLICPNAGVGGLWGDRPSILIGPNPTHGPVTLTTRTERPARMLVTVVDAMGRRVARHDLGTTRGYCEQVIDLSGLAQGVYRILIDLDGKPSVRVIVRE